MLKLKSETAAHLTALATILIWGTTFISTKVLLREFSPIEILFLRFLLGFAALHLVRGKLPFRSWKEERLYAGAGLTGVTLYFLFENIALTYTLASNVGVLVTVAPFFTALLSCFYLRGERPDLRFYAGFVLALAGVTLIMFSGSMTLKLNPAGDILALLAAFVWAVYSVLMKKIGQLGHPMAACTRRTFLYGLAFMLPALFFLDFSPAWGALRKPVNLCNFLYLGLGAEHRRDVPGLDSGQHFLKAGTLHRRTRDTVIHEKNRVGVPFVLGGLLEYLPLILDAVGLAVHIIVTAQSAVERGCAEFVFLT